MTWISHPDGNGGIDSDYLATLSPAKRRKLGFGAETKSAGPARRTRATRSTADVQAQNLQTLLREAKDRALRDELASAKDAIGLGDFRMPGSEPQASPATPGAMMTRRADHIRVLLSGIGGQASIAERTEYINAVREMLAGLEDDTGDTWGTDPTVIEELRARLAEQVGFVEWYRRIYGELQRRIDRPYSVETQRSTDEMGRELSRSQRGWDWLIKERGSEASPEALRGLAVTAVQLGWLTQEQIADLDFKAPTCPEMDAVKAAANEEWARYLEAREAVLDRVAEYAPKRKRHPLREQEARLEAQQIFVLGNCPKSETGITEWITALTQKDLLPQGLVMQIRNAIADLLHPRRMAIG